MILVDFEYYDNLLALSLVIKINNFGINQRKRFANDSNS